MWLAHEILFWNQMVQNVNIGKGYMGMNGNVWFKSGNKKIAASTAVLAGSAFPCCCVFCITGPKLKVNSICFAYRKAVQQMHDLKIHFGPWIWAACSQRYLFYGEEDGGKEWERREYIRLHARESNYLWQATCISCHRGQESSGERREWEMKEDRGGKGRMRKRQWKEKKSEEILWPARPASQFSLRLLIRLIWVNIASQVMPCTWKIQFFGPILGLWLGVTCRSR